MAVPITIDANIQRVSDSGGSSTVVQGIVDSSSGSDRGMLAFCMNDSSLTFTGVTANSSIGFIDSSVTVTLTNKKFQLFHAVGLPTGLSTINAFISSGGSVFGVIFIPVTGCNQFGMIGTAVGGSSTGSSAARIDITATTDDLGVFAGFSNSASSFVAGASGSTVIYTNTSGAFGGQFGASNEAGTGTVSIGGDFDNNEWRGIAVPVHAASAAASGRGSWGTIYGARSIIIP